MVRWSLRTSITLCFLTLAPWQAALAQQTTYPQPPPPEGAPAAEYQTPPPAAPQLPTASAGQGSSSTTVETYVPSTPAPNDQYAPPPAHAGQITLSPQDNARLVQVERRRVTGEVLTIIGAASAVAALGVAGYEAFCIVDCRRQLGGVIIGITAGVAAPSLGVGIALLRSAKRTERNILQPVRRSLSLAPTAAPGGGRFVLSGTF